MVPLAHRFPHSPGLHRQSSRVVAWSCALWLLAGRCVLPSGQEPPAPQAISAQQLRAAVDKLGDLDYATRTAASRAIRRASGPQVVPALIQAVAEHADGYVRYRALVLLTGFNDPRTKDSMRAALSSPNDRLRAVAYSFFERNPDPTLSAQFTGALETEQGEFVRPSLVRALAALAAGENGAPIRPLLLREASRGADFFRSAVVEALGDYKARYAYDALTAIARADGPLQGDAVVALGKIADQRALETLAALQRSAARPVQPSIAAAICLLGVNCSSHENYLTETLKFADKNIGYQELLRASAAGLGVLAVAGHGEALDALVEIGGPSRDPTRAPIALALGTVALRNTPLFIQKLEQKLAQKLGQKLEQTPAQKTDPKLEPPDGRDGLMVLVGEGFDMLEEDLDKERFYALTRRSYWEAPDRSPRRDLMQALIGKLDFD